jgi:putative methionine-R-sulfoxide reductase with GAF domain
MAATVSTAPLASPNRRTRVRQKIHVPAYATLGGLSGSGLIDLYEVLDISESGLSLQCSLSLEIGQTLPVCLDFAEAPQPIPATAHVVWLASGRIGLSIPVLADSAAGQLRQWLFLNALSAADNAQAQALEEDAHKSALPQNYTDILAAATAVQREADSLGPDLEAVLSLLASRSRSLLRCSGAAIALEGRDPAVMICRASSGPTAPPLGAALQIGSGFSGECVRTGKLLFCPDTETDQRVDRQTCRALGIRSILAAPVRIGEKTIGLLEVFCPRPQAFGEADRAVLQRFSETILAALNRAVRAYLPSVPPLAPAKNPPPSPGGVLFAQPESENRQTPTQDEDNVGGVRLPRQHLYLLIAAAAVIALVLGIILAPWVQQQLHARHLSASTVFAYSAPPARPSPLPPYPSPDPSNIAQLRDLAAHGDPAAENALGLLYIAGDQKQGITPNDSTAAHWFTQAAEHGSVPAQSKLGSLYWGGRGLPKDDSQAYFWAVLARAAGDDASKVLAPFIAARLTQPQRVEIEQQAEQWLQSRHPARTSPN